MSAESPSARAGGSAGGAAPATTPDAVMLAAFNAAFDAAMHGDCDLDEANLAGIRAALAARPAAAPATTPDATAAHEEMAAAFYADTGLLAPGKDAPIELYGADYEAKRMGAWLLWAKGYYRGAAPTDAEVRRDFDTLHLIAYQLERNATTAYAPGELRAIALRLVARLRGPGAAAPPTDGEATHE